MKTIIVGLLSLAVGVLLGFNVMRYTHVKKEYVATAKEKDVLTYCAKPNSYLKRILATNNTFLMYMRKKDYKYVIEGLKAENEALRRTVLWNEINLEK